MTIVISMHGSCCEENQADRMDSGEMMASESMVREGCSEVTLELRPEL